MKRHFIQDPSVTDVLADNGVSDIELRVLETAIMRGAGVMIPGTGGLKKIRCALSGRGKSGAVRVIFADYPGAGRTYLLTAFGKNEMANVSKAERNNLCVLKRVLDRAVERLVQNEGA